MPAGASFGGKRDSSVLEHIRSVEGWYYEFELEGYKTPVARPEHAVRHRMRRQYLMDPVLELWGGNLRGRRVLDLGCNEGYFSLAALQAEAAFVLGLDPQADRLQRAGWVFQASRIDPDRYELRCADVDALRPEAGRFDVVLLLGLLHWLPVAQAIRLLNTLSQMQAELLVVDTVVCAERGPVLRLRRQSLGPADPYRDGRICLLPSPAGLLDLMESFGYRGVVLRPQFADWTGSEDYRSGVRRGFLFARSLDFSRLTVPTEPAADRPSDALQDASWKELIQALGRKLLRQWTRRR
jgi:SAM-dependent methyltransferase